jgi:hypothetical protein
MEPKNFDESMAMFDERPEEDDDYTWVTYNGHSQRISSDQLKDILKDHPGVMTPEQFYDWKEKKEAEFAQWYDNKLAAGLPIDLNEVDDETNKALEYEDYSAYLETKLYAKNI